MSELVSMTFKPLFLRVYPVLSLSFIVCLSLSHTHTYTCCNMTVEVHHCITLRGTENLLLPRQATWIREPAWKVQRRDNTIGPSFSCPQPTYTPSNTHTAFGLHTLAFSQPVGAVHLRLSYFSCEDWLLEDMLLVWGNIPARGSCLLARWHLEHPPH